MDAEEVFPTYYRCNTPQQLDRLLQEAGLRRETLLTTDQTYEYLYFSDLTYVIGLLYSRAIGLRGLGWLRNIIIGVYTRPA